jgi:hypothetical protein
MINREHPTPAQKIRPGPGGGGTFHDPVHTGAGYDFRSASAVETRTGVRVLFDSAITVDIGGSIYSVDVGDSLYSVEVL